MAFAFFFYIVLTYVIWLFSESFVDFLKNCFLILGGIAIASIGAGLFFHFFVEPWMGYIVTGLIVVTIWGVVSDWWLYRTKPPSEGTDLVGKEKK